MGLHYTGAHLIVCLKSDDIVIVSIVAVKYSGVLE